jgi:hypothetical protein
MVCFPIPCKPVPCYGLLALPCVALRSNARRHFALLALRYLALPSDAVGHVALLALHYSPMRCVTAHCWLCPALLASRFGALLFCHCRQSTGVHDLEPPMRSRRRLLGGVVKHSPPAGVRSLGGRFFAGDFRQRLRGNRYTFAQLGLPFVPVGGGLPLLIL